MALEEISRCEGDHLDNFVWRSGRRFKIVGFGDLGFLDGDVRSEEENEL